jgi:HD-GYP domain-containing protein (c-di-GMP phosphodiesterase class II)
MIIDYKRELENAAKNMILVHEPDTLIRMIARMLVQKVKVTHAGILLYDKEKNTYILTVSRGPTGKKIPAGFARVDVDNPLIRFFKERCDKQLFPQGAIILEEAKKTLRKTPDPYLKELLKKVLYQMEIFEAVICIPNFFRDELMGIAVLGAKSSGRRFGHKEIDFFLALASDVAMAIRNAQLFQELELELHRKYRLFIHTTVALAAAIDAKDHYTHGHTARVTELSLKIANKLREENKKVLGEKFIEHLHIASLLHDIGKIGVPESILNKEGALTEEELKKMREHPLVGSVILQPIKELEDAILGVKYHHERYDGSGYPEGLKGDQIPLIAAIISVADAFDAMVTDRPYRRAFSKEEAINEIRRVSGKQFDSRLAEALIDLYQEGKI